MIRPTILLAVLFAACSGNAPLKPVKEPGAPCGRVFSWCGNDTDGAALCCGPEYFCEERRRGYCAPKGQNGSESAFGGLVGAKAPVRATRVTP